MTMLSDRERWIALNMVSGLGPVLLRRLHEAFGTLERLWQADVQELQRVQGVGPALAKRLAEMCGDEQRVEHELAIARRHGARLLTLEDAGYPRRLRTIPDPPPVLYVKGALEPMDDIAVAIVGARRASLYGLECAGRLGYDLALRGITIVSGLARGIDGAAHQGALKAGGRTIAVLGSGLSHLYPPEHVELAEHIAKQGAVISEYPMEMEPLPHNFPRRNRIISGLSLGVIVVEAGPKSGALITADCALEQGREVFAVPGPITSVVSHGTHQLLKQGAKLVTSVEDILEELNPFLARGSGLGAQSEPSAPNPEPLYHRAHSPEPGATSGLDSPDAEQRVLTSVEADTPAHVDAIVTRSGLAADEVSSTLLQLELRQLVRQLPGKRFIRTDQV